ncbi:MULTISPECIES: CaiB/BaiF CoA-transferase family protein [unclassified Chelatococcus]|uniref:CaiB/BaiF CoA transferase family protein n=1 Tax=unclassified Chelatococcus TaxID=2638111 RepID=UPI0002DAA0BC|nr:MULTISPECIES: CaiB/BaiF CoA-transferase family protein [unclassified Chelatococcus]ALA20043.1 CoA-transferase [Chelatococcus sp. CO-6]
MHQDNVQPLTGIRVIDFSQVMLGPSATQVLADYGADVIKIERPGVGDLSRASVPDDPDGPNNPVFRSLNRNKRSVALDLRREEGREVIYDLVRTADVVVNNFRAGVMERMGFGYERLAEINPRIICAFGTGFGMSGPLAYKGGQDILAQALSGVMLRKCNDDEPLTIYATSLCDYSAGMHLVQAILLALLHRERTGRGQQVSVSLFESMLAMQMQEAAMWLQRGKDFSWGAYPLTGVFRTRDGAIVLVGAFKTNPLRDISTALGLQDLSQDQRYATFQGQVAHKAELQALFRERFATNTTEHWLARLDEQDLLCAPVLNLSEALAHDQTKANGTVVSLKQDDALGLVGTPLTMHPSAFQHRYDPPDLGAHGDEVLAEAGFAGERIAALKAAGVLA